MQRIQRPLAKLQLPPGGQLPQCPGLSWDLCVCWLMPIGRVTLLAVHASGSPWLLPLTLYGGGLPISFQKSLRGSEGFMLPS